MKVKTLPYYHQVSDAQPRHDVSILHTFFWFLKKKAYGSMPYATVLPITGSQWKTMGGSFGFLSSSCFKTLSTTARRRKEAKPEAMRTGRDELEV